MLRTSVDLVLDRIIHNGTTFFKPSFSIVHVDEACWFFLIRDNEIVRVYSREEKVGYIDVEQSHSPRVMLICMVSCPHFALDFDGKTGIWGLFVVKSYKRLQQKN